MNLRLITPLIVFISLIAAVVFGQQLAEQNYFYIVLFLLLVGYAGFVLKPNYSLVLAIGLLSPFYPPLPFIRGLPPAALALGLCVATYLLRASVRSSERKYVSGVSFWMFLFMALVTMRYFLNPVLPGFALGLSDDVTGFRAYFNYGICFALALSVGFFYRDQRSIITFIKCCIIISLILAFLFATFTFMPFPELIWQLRYLGIYIVHFDNGWLRFVVLPSFGLMLIYAYLLPNLFSKNTAVRISLLLLGVAAVILGGLRTSILSTFLIFLFMAIIHRQHIRLACYVTALLLMLTAFYYIGENTRFPQGYGLWRVMGIVSPQVAKLTDGKMNVEWRYERWRYAWEDIKSNPLIGVGYTGVANVFKGTYSTAEELENVRLKMDVATGNVHNGYIAAARSFGMPAALVFVFILVSRTIAHFQLARTYISSNPAYGQINAFFFLNLVIYFPSIYVGTDLNQHILWFLLALGLVAEKVGLTNTRVA